MRPFKGGLQICQQKHWSQCLGGITWLLLCRTIEKGTVDWEARRRALLLMLAPSFGQHGAKAYLDRVVKYAVEGNAWHADHIMPVHKGGGLCGLENLRTLCVLCHMVRLCSDLRPTSWTVSVAIAVWQDCNCSKQLQRAGSCSNKHKRLSLILSNEWSC